MPISAGCEATSFRNSCSLSMSANVWASKVLCDWIKVDNASRLRKHCFSPGMNHNNLIYSRFGTSFFHCIPDIDSGLKREQQL